MSRKACHPLNKPHPKRQRPAPNRCPSPRPQPGPLWRRRPPETDREALVALYNATDGKYWFQNTNWLSDFPLGEWNGVTTDDAGRVARLDLGSNLLTGEIPAEMGNLSNLTTLDLGSNGLIGEIPAEIGNLSNLTRLDLFNNRLNGEIPPELGNLSNLTWLLLYNNELSGEIPPELGNLSNLTGLMLFDNDLSGCVPSSLKDQLSPSGPDGLPFCSAPTPITTDSGGTPTATDAPSDVTGPNQTAAFGSVETDREALVAIYNATGGEKLGW